MTVPPQVAILLFSDDENRALVLRTQLSMILPGASIRQLKWEDLSEGSLTPGDVAVIDVDCGASMLHGDSRKARGGEIGTAVKNAMQPATFLRARGFTGSVILIASVPDEKALSDTGEALGVVTVSRGRGEEAPTALAKALSLAFGPDARVTPALTRARRIFAAGQAALSLQHAINNPLAALMAEAQLLQMEELKVEQQGSVDRIVELCRRISVLVRQLDALTDG